MHGLSDIYRCEEKLMIRFLLLSDLSIMRYQFAPTKIKLLAQFY